MGSYNKFFLDCDDQTQDIEIINFLNSTQGFYKPPFAQDWFYRSWSESTKWYFDNSSLRNLSLKFPKTMFRLICNGEDNYTLFALAGKVVNSVYLGFPTEKLFKVAAKKEQDVIDLNNKKHEERLKQEKQKKIESLEKEKQRISTEIQKLNSL